MIGILRAFVKSIPTLILSFVLGAAVWISAVNAADPVRKDTYARPVAIEQVGLSTSMVISANSATQATFKLSAPASSWERINSDRNPVRAWVDLSGIEPGTHTLPVNYEVLEKPAKVVSYTPQNVTITLEKLLTKEYPVHLIRRGEPAIGFQTDTPTLTPDKVTISGAQSKMERIKDVTVSLDLTQINDNITRKLDIKAVDANDVVIDGLSITPTSTVVTQPVSQRGGYRNVVIKVVSTGQVVSGYRLTNISVVPPTVTIFSTNPQLIEQIPGFVETSPLDLTGVKDDIDRQIPLNLPTGVEVVGDQTVLVQVGVAAIEGSITLSGVPVQVLGLPPELVARLSPETVDVIISGPVPLLDKLTISDVLVSLDLTSVAAGKYQFAPKVIIAISELKLESILPSSIEVVVESRASGAARQRLTPTPTPTPTPTATPTASAP